MPTAVFHSAIPGLSLPRDIAAGPVGRQPVIGREVSLTLAGAKTGLFGAG